MRIIIKQTCILWQLLSNNFDPNFIYRCLHYVAPNDVQRYNFFPCCVSMVNMLFPLSIFTSEKTNTTGDNLLPAPRQHFLVSCYLSGSARGKGGCCLPCVGTAVFLAPVSSTPTARQWAATSLCWGPIAVVITINPSVLIQIIPFLIA